MNHEDPARKYRAFVRAVNREPPPDDEYAALAAYDALTEAYGLERYPTPPIPEGRPRASNAARLGGVFASYEGRRPPCRG